MPAFRHTQFRTHIFVLPTHGRSVVLHQDSGWAPEGRASQDKWLQTPGDESLFWCHCHQRASDLFKSISGGELVISLGCLLQIREVLGAKFTPIFLALNYIRTALYSGHSHPSDLSLHATSSGASLTIPFCLVPPPPLLMVPSCYLYDTYLNWFSCLSPA